MPITLEEIRQTLNACRSSNAYQRWHAQQQLKDHAEEYIDWLLDQLDPEREAHQ